MKVWTAEVSDSEWKPGGEGFGGRFLCPKCGSKYFDYSVLWFKYNCYDCGFYTEQLPPEHDENLVL